MTTARTNRGAVLMLGAVLAGWAGVVAPPASPAAAAPGDFTVSPTTLNFPGTYVGDSAEMTVTVTNVSATTQSPSFSGGAPFDADNFGGSQNCAGVPLDPGDSCEFTYEFHPVSVGSHSSSTTIGIDSDNFSISMSGDGLSPFSVAPLSLSFPDTAVGSTSSLEVVVTNVSPVSQSPNFSGGAPLDPVNFGGSQNCAGVPLAAGASCEFTYEFHPTSLGAHASNTTIGVDAENFAITLTGSAVDPSATTTTTSSATTSSTAPSSSTSSSTTGPATSAAPTSTGAPLVPGPGSGPVAKGHAQVIAQGIIAFPDGPFRWDVQRLEGPWPFEFAASPPVFIVAQGPEGIVVQGPAGGMALLEAGEATFVEPGSSGLIVPRALAATAVADRVTFVAGGGAGSFVPEAGARDVNVIRDVLAPGESLTVSSQFPLLVIPDGALTVVGGGDAPLPDGVATTLGPTVELRNDGPEAASVVVAAVGDALT